MSEAPSERNVATKTTAAVSNSANIGAKVATSNYKIHLPTKGANVVNIIDKTRGAVRNGKTVGEWIVRVDGPHRGANFNHININPSVSHIPDPHIPITGATLNGAKTSAKILKGVNKVMLPVAIAVDTVRVGYNLCQDVKRGTSRNTMTTAASVAGGWGGGFGGAAAGAAIGSAIFPGIGTILFGIIGGLSGGIGGAVGAEAAVSAIGDECEWDIEIYHCKKCEKRFKCRKYTKQSRMYCPNCEEYDE